MLLQQNGCFFAKLTNNAEYQTSKLYARQPFANFQCIIASCFVYVVDLLLIYFVNMIISLKKYVCNSVLCIGKGSACSLVKVPKLFTFTLFTLFQSPAIVHQIIQQRLRVLCWYSGTSNKRPSEIGMTSLQKDTCCGTMLIL